MSKIANKSRLGDIPQDVWPVLLETVNVVKNRKIWETVTEQSRPGDLMTK